MLSPLTQGKLGAMEGFEILPRDLKITQHEK